MQQISGVVPILPATAQSIFLVRPNIAEINTFIQSLLPVRQGDVAFEVPRGATVIASHKAFDEVLTVGNNIALAAKLGMAMALRTDRAMLKSQLETEFGSFEKVFGFDEEERDGDITASEKNHDYIRCVAIMNAFHPEEVDLVAALAVAMELVPSMEDCRGVLYLTGAVREPGLEAALRKGMAVVCVGHHTCEEWGIRHLASVFRERWPGLQVQKILEAEEVRAVKSSNGKVNSATQPQLTDAVNNRIDSIK
ncbi:hypothetical protein PG994_008441 [Apiospora phragmitis]|uniref:Uncharacterized protein n=1 Tax=Apiospora phragmitis TaxID=2905665 RepID=A0ABR1UJB5_9PEZI